MHKRPDLKSPKTFNEKLQWMELYYHKPEFMEKIEREYIIPTLGMLADPDEIDFDKRPNQLLVPHACQR